MHYTSTQHNGAEYDPTDGSDKGANGGGSDSVPARNEQISTRLERKTQRMARRSVATSAGTSTATSNPNDPYTQDSFTQDHHEHS